MQSRAVVAALLLSISSLAGCNDIVFSARRFIERHGKFYPRGTAHLYRMRGDGSGIHQITFGNQEDLRPFLLPDGKRIFFWRDSNKLFSVDPSGRRLKNEDLVFGDEGGYPNRNSALERLSPTPFHLRSANSKWPNARYDLTDASGRTVKRFDGPDTDRLAFSPSASKALVYSGNRLWVVDLMSGSSRDAGTHFSATAWVDDNLFLVDPDDRSIDQVDELGSDGRFRRAINLEPRDPPFDMRCTQGVSRTALPQSPSSSTTRGPRTIVVEP